MANPDDSGWPLQVGAGAALSAVETEEQTAEQTETRTASPWNVIVHDDPITPMPYVTKVLQDVFGFPLTKAESLMLRVHHTGRAVVWSGAREAAEAYVQRLQGQHLRTTLEQSES